MTESRSLMVRSGIMTSFCATTVVTPFFVTVFMMDKKEEWKGCVEGDNGILTVAPVDVSEEKKRDETKKWGEASKSDESHFIGVSIN